MSGVNPIVLIQMMLQYHNYKDEGKRTFKFTKNNLMRIHTETDEEEAARKSRLSPETCKMAIDAIKDRLEKVLNGRIDKAVYIDPKMKKIAVPMMSTGHTGYGMFPTGSRIAIPEGRFVRAFTYWENVNDIDLSCIGLTEDGCQREFSWRNMAYNQGMDICFSGDETSGYKGGSEYFDIDIDLFKANHPELRYLVFCDNIYSDDMTFNRCNAKAGFMIRDKMEPNTVGHYAQNRKIFLPKTVANSFKVISDSTFCYMFAIDLKTREMVWLNLDREGRHAIAGEEQMAWLLDYMTITDVINVYDLFVILATKLVVDYHYADILVTDEDLPPVNGRAQEIIRSWDNEKIFQYLQVG